MKPIIAIAAAISFAIAGTAPAFAYHLIPESSDFTGSGKTSATKNGITLKCNANFTGNVNRKGVGLITGGSFTGAVGCSSVGLGGLPWKSVATSATKIKIVNVSFTSPIGDCGPGNLVVKLSSGVITFKGKALPGGCTVSGTVTTSPTLSIVP